MNIDLSQFDNLELDNIGQWPKAAKIMLAVFLSVLTLALGFFLVVSDKIKNLENTAQQEQTLKQEYQAKYHIAANLETFQQQMEDAEAMFATQLKSLPESHETPGLLDDITFVGTTSGLNFKHINWQPEIIQEIYVELPIDIEVVGNYHDFGNFVSKIAGLPRIVTIQDFKMTINDQNKDILTLKIQAKTYRYRESQS
ncbi:type IV pilus inner membrane component PilO [Thalassotalea eurytherma]|uniref:Pilus assembly protein PilO n=1 Tax=Thalassotalea eurytherma TaxID=1144278 RepID=A0ABQ6H5J6_9GAMM|nr:type 4a pilus biogenesis protein PilO [Thalassotalea eurytherma]GLX82030.1 pilus assembly protein PilO [Thalassotalea eurytherma]